MSEFARGSLSRALRGAARQRKNHNLRRLGNTACKACMWDLTTRLRAFRRRRFRAPIASSWPVAARLVVVLPSTKELLRHGEALPKQIVEILGLQTRMIHCLSCHLAVDKNYHENHCIGLRSDGTEHCQRSSSRSRGMRKPDWDEEKAQLFIVSFATVQVHN